MGCEYLKNCGGCPLRDMKEEQYRLLKESKVKSILDTALKQKEYIYTEHR